MNLSKAIEVLGQSVLSNAGIHANDDPHVNYINGNDTVELDGSFTAEHLEALAWWMRNVGGVK